MKKRSIPLSIIFSCITCGIYLLFWAYSIAEDLIRELGYEGIDNAGLNVVWLVLTFGLYYFWWNYKVCSYLSTIERRNNIEPDFWAPLMSLWFGLILHQSRINRVVK